MKERVLELYVEKCADYGPTLAAEWLAQEDGLEVAASTLRCWRINDGLWQRQRKRRGASSCRWMDRIMIGSKVTAAGRC